MSNAEDLLAGVSLAEENTATEEHVVIETDRFAIVPPDLKKIAVAGDKDVKTIVFDCPRYWDDGRVDLTSMKICINYMRPDGEPGKYHADDAAADEDDPTVIHFSWTISKHVAAVKGTISFLVCAVVVNEDGDEVRHWNSELNRELTVSEGLEVDDIILSQYPSIITQMLTDIDYLKTHGGSGGSGTPGEDGGYYSLSFEQATPDTLTVKYIPSKAGMPAIESKTFTLPAGPQGDKGDKGDTGDTGPKGDKGDKGDTGDTGPKGDKGDKGDTGDTGPKGDKGDTGDTGPKGDKGDTGDTGPKGDKGDPGESAASVPDYISEEADRVAKQTLSRVAENSLVFVAESDIHNNPEGYGEDWFPKLLSSLDCVVSQLPCDFIVDLGDIFEGRADTPTEDVNEEARVANSYINKAHRGLRSIRVLGNHDVMWNTVRDRYSFANAYNSIYDDPEWTVSGDVKHGYYMRHYSNKNVYVFVLNLNEKSDSTYSSNISTSVEQRRWLCEMLENIAVDQHVLLLTHQPIDFGSNESPAGERVLEIVKAFESGSSIKVGGKTYIFKKGRFANIVNVHGHLHNFTTLPVDGTSQVMRVCIPNAAPSRTNEYGKRNLSNGSPDWDFRNKWGDPNIPGESVYAHYKNPEVSINVEDKNFTAFNAVVADLDGGKMHAINFGAGRDREEIAIGNVIRTVKVLCGDNVTVDEPITRVVAGGSYTTTLKFDDGYILDTVTNASVAGNTMSIDLVDGDTLVMVTAKLPGVMINLLDEVGYSDDTYLSSSGDSAKTGIVATGYLPYMSKFYVYGAEWDGTSDCRLATYNSSKAAVEMYYSNSSECFAPVDGADGWYEVTTPGNANTYIRLCLRGSGSNLIITETSPV